MTESCPFTQQDSGFNEGSIVPSCLPLIVGWIKQEGSNPQTNNSFIITILYSIIFYYILFITYYYFLIRYITGITLHLYYFVP